MKLKNYIADRISLLLVMFFSFVFFLIFLSLIGIDRDIVCFLAMVYPGVFVVYFICDFLYTKKQLYTLEGTMDLLDKKYLIGEVAGKKGTYQQKFYMELVRRACKSMMDELQDKEKQNIEYKEYTDSWIHEVKTPITAIQLICDNERNVLTDRIKIETKKVEMDIERMLYYAKSDETWKDYVIAPHSLRDIVDGSIMKVYQIFIYQGVRISVDIEEEIVYTDAKWASFIITQILLNCVQYQSDTPLVISIYPKKEKESTCLIIEDNGLGIKPEEIRHIFEKGYVGTNGRKNERSSGMGMYICSKLCKKLNIGIRAESEYGEYTKMILTFGEGTFYASCENP